MGDEVSKTREYRLIVTKWRLDDAVRRQDEYGNLGQEETTQMVRLALDRGIIH